jgi:hypothetical protein
MVNHKTKDAARPQAPVAPKRKRLGSEQERRERKRAIDREAQRSLREKTKTRIAELERTVELLRDTDRNQATASLLSEIDALRAENRRLKEIVDSVRSIVGSNVACQNVVPAGSAYGQGSENNSPPAADVGRMTTFFAQRGRMAHTIWQIRAQLSCVLIPSAVMRSYPHPLMSIS